MLSTVLHSSLLCSFVYLVLLNWLQMVGAVPLSGGDSPSASLLDLLRMANGQGSSQFENFDKRRSRELFGKRSLGAEHGGYERSSRRSHELFGKRSDPEMIQEQEEMEPLMLDKLTEASSLLNQEDEIVNGDAAVLNFLTVSGYPTHFPSSKMLSQKISIPAPELQPKTVLKRRNRELFGKRSTIAPGSLELSDMEESQLNALLSFLATVNQHQQPRQRRARGGELFGK